MYKIKLFFARFKFAIVYLFGLIKSHKKTTVYELRNKQGFFEKVNFIKFYFSTTKKILPKIYK